MRNLLFYGQTMLADGATFYVSDVPAHHSLIRQWAEGDLVIPHFGLALLVVAVRALTPFDLSWAIVAVLSTSLLASVWTMWLVVGRLSPPGLERWREVSVLLLLVVSACYLPAFNEQIYLGQGGPNPWHSPTTLLVKPLALWTVFWFATERTPVGRRWPALLRGAVLAVTVCVKPNFFLTFVPAWLLWLLFGPGSTRRPFRNLLADAVPVVLPGVLVLTWAFLGTYTVVWPTPEGESSIIIAPLRVWSLYTPSVVVSLLLALAFPLSLLAVDRHVIRTSRFMQLAWLNLLVGIAQFALLAESGERLAHGNWGWGYNIGLHVVFVASFVCFTHRLANLETMEKRSRRRLILPAACLVWHVSSGAFYTMRVLSGGSPL